MPRKVRLSKTGEIPSTEAGTRQPELQTTMLTHLWPPRPPPPDNLLPLNLPTRGVSRPLLATALGREELGGGGGIACGNRTIKRAGLGLSLFSLVLQTNDGKGGRRPCSVLLIQCIIATLIRQTSLRFDILPIYTKRKSRAREPTLSLYHKFAPDKLKFCIVGESNLN